ncbi:CoA ester lyase [Pseudomonas marginalis]|nr:CoA ester lyase [Pseudomonas marginalis]
MNTMTRSWLCMPASQKHMERKIIESSADIVLLDLEDSVPMCKKQFAREQLLALDPSIRGRCNLAIRVNTLAKSEGIRDLVFLLDHNIIPEYLIIPKVESSGELRVLNELTCATGQRVKTFAIIETLKGLRCIDSIINERTSLRGLILGSADISSEINFKIAERALIQIKCDIAIAAHSMSLMVIDSPCFKLNNDKALRSEIEIAKEFGYSGKIAIHPSQVELINKLFTPTATELKKARAIIKCLEASEPLTAISSLDGEMLGPPFEVMARRLLAINESLSKFNRKPA